MNLSDIDFAQLYRDQVRQSKRPSKVPEYWDGRAESMSQRAFDSPYVRQFVDRMNLEGCATLLDVGCGPGGIGLTMASRLQHVYGLDYSAGMLAAFAENARQRGVTWATPIHRAWEDDWTDVPVCDVVVASRSTAVPDLAEAVMKIEAKARRRVYMSYPADGHLVGDDVCREIGRPGEGLPDYLCVMGVLHQLGIRPTLDYLAGSGCLSSCGDFEGYLSKVEELIGPLNPGERDRLLVYFDANRDRLGRETVQWALFTWESRSVADARI